MWNRSGGLLPIPSHSLITTTTLDAATRIAQGTSANSSYEARSLPQVVCVAAQYTAFHLDGGSQRDQGQQADSATNWGHRLDSWHTWLPAHSLLCMRIFVILIVVVHGVVLFQFRSWAWISTLFSESVFDCQRALIFVFHPPPLGPVAVSMIDI